MQNSRLLPKENPYKNVSCAGGRNKVFSKIVYNINMLAKLRLIGTAFACIVDLKLSTFLRRIWANRHQNRHQIKMLDWEKISFNREGRIKTYEKVIIKSVL